MVADLGWVDFDLGCSIILIGCPASYDKLPPALAVLGKHWDIIGQVLGLRPPVSPCRKILFHPQNLTQELLLRKRRLCEEFLEVYTKIDPGSSDWRGSTLFELAMTKAELAQRYIMNSTG